MFHKLLQVISGILITIVLVINHNLCEAQIDLKEEHIDMVILLDRSGSMESTDPEGLSVSAASFVIEQISLSNKKNRVAVVPFASEAQILGQEKPNPPAALTQYSAALIEMMRAGISDAKEFTFRENSPDSPNVFLKLLQMQIQIKNNGFTELGKALDLAKKILGSSNPDARKVVFLISDGMPEFDIASEDRLKELRKLFGSTIDKKTRNERIDTFSKYLLPIISDLAKEGISIYPVAFHGKDKESGALVKYLKQIKLATTGDEEIISVNADTLISKLVEYIPSGANHIRLHNIKGFINGSPSSVTIPEIALQTRFFFSYKNTRKSHNPGVKILRDGELVADSQSPELYDALVFNLLRKRNGSIVYHSFRIENPDMAKGEFRIEVSDNSTGGVEGIPDTDLFIDIRSSLYPEVEVIPETISAMSPLEMRFKLFAKIKKDIKVEKIKRTDIFVIGREPENVKGLSFRLKSIKYEKGVAISNIREGLPKAGNYLFKTKLYFQPHPESSDAYVYFTYPVEVQSPWSLEGNVWIAKKGTQNKIKGTLPLDSLGEKFTISSKAIEVRTLLKRSVDNLNAVLLPFSHSETQKELKSINRNWAKVTPNFLRGLTEKRPVPLKIDIKLPSEIPPVIPDGIYQSELEIRDGVKVLYSVPLTIKVSIPRFVFNKEDIDKDFDPDEEVNPRIVEKTIRYPGKDISHFMKINLWSTSLSGAKAKGYFAEKKGLRYKKDNESEERMEHVLFDIAGETFKIPGKTERMAGTIEVAVTISDTSINNMNFVNTLYITGKQHRELPVKLLVKVNHINSGYLRAVYLFLLIFGIYLLYRWWRLIKLRDFFVGAEIERNINEGEPDDHKIELDRRILGRFSYNGDELFGVRNSFISFEAENARYIRDDRTENVPESYYPEEGDEIIIGRRKRRFRIKVNKLPSADDLSYSYSIEQSPLKTGKIRFIYLFTSVILSFISVFNLIDPYLMLKLIKF